MRTRNAFTLIELLIVVAIIAILAAIAVPNFLEAQTRAKVSRTVADMRSLGTAIETYTIDYNRAPMTVSGYNTPTNLNGPSLINSALPGIAWTSYRFKKLTTPVAYITQVFPDVFAKGGATKVAGGGTSANYDSFDYLDDKLDDDFRSINNTTGGNTRFAGLTSGSNWRVSSCGPDNIQAFGGAQVGSNGLKLGYDYDATNGTISNGDIVRVGGPGKIANVIPGIDRVRNVINDPVLK